MRVCMYVGKVLGRVWGRSGILVRLRPQARIEESARQCEALSHRDGILDDFSWGPSQIQTRNRMIPESPKLQDTLDDAGELGTCHYEGWGSWGSKDFGTLAVFEPKAPADGSDARDASVFWV